MAIFFLLSISSARAAEDITGLEWMELSAGQKMERIRMSMAVLGYHKVFLKDSANAYYNAVSQAIRANPAYYSMDLTQVLAAAASEKDGEVRAALEQYKIKQKS